MKVNRSRIQYFLIDSLRRYSENFQLDDTSNPISFRLNGRSFSVHVSSVHDSGKNRKNPDERRIQIPTTVLDEQRRRKAAGIEVGFIGFFPDGKVFSAWEPAHALAQRAEEGGSVYARESHYDLVLDNGGALRQSRSTNLKRQVTTISLSSEALGYYLENIGAFHQFSSQKELQNLIDRSEVAILENSMIGETIIDVTINGKRRKVQSIRYAYPRNRKFSEDVLAAYKGCCAICGRQLGLVQAAHLVPHNIEDSTDDIFNGMALCVEHHKLYDDALLLPFLDRSLLLNPDRIQFLKETDRISGLDDLVEIAKRKYRVPERDIHRPKADNLKRAARLRMGRDP